MFGCNSMLVSLFALFLLQSSFISESAPVNSESCVDVLPQCSAAAAFGYCLIYKDWGASFCKKTCGACQVQPTTDTTTVHLASSTTVKSTSTTESSTTTAPPTLTTVTTQSTLITTRSTAATNHPTSTTETCGIQPDSKQRIVGGTMSARNAWPWMAQIASSNGFVFCGGSLISSQWIVTAAHCVLGYITIPSAVKVRLGAHFREQSITIGTEQTLRLSKIIVHPNYNTPLPLSNDIALLKLSRPASINNKVSPVCVPAVNSSSGFAPNMTCFVTGWGHLKVLGPFADQLMQAEVPIQSKSTCRTAYPRLVDNSMVCAGPSQGGVDACQGDSGGPLVCSYNKVKRWYLEGVVSWGHGCAAPGLYGVYSKVRHLNDWIQKTMKKY